jgi:hypothetical protein
MGRIRYVVTGAFALAVLSACGGNGTGFNKAATVSCSGDDCTVTYPAKARNNQSSSGGAPAQVLGVQAQLYSIAGGQANFRIADQPVTIEAGKKKTVGDLTVQAVSITDTEAVLKISKGKAKAKSTAKPKASAKATSTSKS